MMNAPDRVSTNASKAPLLRDICSQIHNELSTADSQINVICQALDRTVNPVPAPVGSAIAPEPAAGTLEAELRSILRRLERHAIDLSDAANRLQSAV